jgi:hypothetical protein
VCSSDLLFGSVLEQQGIERGKFHADIKKAYDSYCGKVEVLEALQKRMAPEFNEFHTLYHMDLIDYPASNLREAEEKNRL